MLMPFAGSVIPSSNDAGPRNGSLQTKFDAALIVNQLTHCLLVAFDRFQISIGSVYTDAGSLADCLDHIIG